MMSAPIVVVAYQSSWRTRFEELHAQLSQRLGSLSAGIEHIGSTAIPGLHAKPIIDIDVIIPSNADFQQVRVQLSSLGYVHVGDQGVAGREAFELQQGVGAVNDHHLYVCRENAEELRRHVQFRDYLLLHSEAAAEYGRLKRELALRYRDDREAYTDAKSQFITQILERPFDTC
jgi:GrpB-like predicted nucleotidyltransferase (UPF0157 family)